MKGLILICLGGAVLGLIADDGADFVMVIITLVLFGIGWSMYLGGA